MTLVVVGDTLLDRDVTGRADRLSPDAPVPVVTGLSESDRPGGAALAALLAARDGADVVLVTALGSDPAAQRVAVLLAEVGVRIVAGRLAGGTPVKERIRVAGQSLLRLDREETAPGAPEVTEAMRAATSSAAAVLVSDYGRGLTANSSLRAALESVRGPVVWDPHPRGSAPAPGVRLAIPNLSEALAFSGIVAAGGMIPTATRAARALAGTWRADRIAVTLGEAGALLAGTDDVPVVSPALPATGDPCGAGDRFAATVATALAAGALPSEAVTAAVAAASAYVAAGGPASLAGARVGGRDSAAGPEVDARAEPAAANPAARAAEVARRVRAAGGTVVATGGCFDLLHAGHVATLEAARRLGDCLIVCLNSDDSVRRLKGEGRPLVAERDRVRVLEALAAVDAVIVFEQDTPLAVLDALRPDLWVKGGDYTAEAMPETTLLSEWGGQVVVVPYLAGRSTTRLVETAGRRDG